MKRTASTLNRITVALPEERLEDSSSWVEVFFEVRYSTAGGDVAILDVFVESARAWLGDWSTPVPLGDDRWEAEACRRFSVWLKGGNLERVEALCRGEHERECELRREEGLP